MLRDRGRIASALIAAALTVAVAVIALNPGILRYFRREAVISVAGDILLDRGVAQALEQNGSSYPYEEVARLFRRDDITVANLECPLTASGSCAMKGKQYVFKADPSNATILKAAGFDALILANNHTMDYVSEGLTETMRTLEKAGIAYSGAGPSRNAIRPCFLEANGVSIGILSYSSLPPRVSSMTKTMRRSRMPEPVFSIT
jgi:poly-gamma-glutamate synthesis protein (capsule biosynthesis protein)